MPILNLSEYKFILIPVKSGDLIRGPAVYNEKGERIGQLIVEVKENISNESKRD